MIDLTIDTGKHQLDMVLKIIIDAYQTWLKE